MASILTHGQTHKYVPIKIHVHAHSRQRVRNTHTHTRAAQTQGHTDKRQALISTQAAS